MVCLTLSISRYFRLFKGKVYKSDIYDLKELSLEIPINLKLYLGFKRTVSRDSKRLKWYLEFKGTVSRDSNKFKVVFRI